MSGDAYAKWVGRGNAHLAAGRTVDALICFRRAQREAPQGGEARFQLGKIAWQLGDSADAIALWRRAAEESRGEGSPPVDLLAWRALADSLAMLGRFDDALHAVHEVLARRPHSKRMRSLVALLDVARDRERRAPDAHAAALTGVSLSDTAITDAELSVALAARRPWPLALLAAVVPRLTAEQTSAELLQKALDCAWRSASEGPVLRGSEDGLRGLALAFAAAGDRDRAKVLAVRYEMICAGLAAGSPPLHWPQRAGGGALRVAILHSMAADAASVWAEGLQLALDRESTPVGAHATPRLTTVDLASLPADPDAAARRVAADDFDVLLDVDGLTHASAPLLARRPVRRLWGFVRGEVPATPTLVERVFGDSIEEVATALCGMTQASQQPDTHSELAARRDGAVIAHRDGDDDAARAGYDWVLAREPADPQTLYLRAMLERDRGHAGQAIADLRAAVEAAPGYADARAALAQLLTGEGAAADAAVVAQAGLARASLAQAGLAQAAHPQSGPVRSSFGELKHSAPLWRALGQAELARGDGAAAAAAFGAALARAPEHAETHYNHGVALQQQGDLDGAMRAWQRAIALDPSLAAAHYNLGLAFDRRRRTGAAVAALTRARELAPGHAGAYKALGETLHAAAQIDAWVENFRRFEANCPDHIAVAPMGIEVAAWTGDSTTLDRMLDGLRRDRFGARDASDFIDALQQLLFLLLYVDVEPELVVRYSRVHNELARRFYGEPWPRATSRRAGRIRVGYVSGDFRDHVMGKMIWEALRHHDRTRFEIFGYTTDPRRDAWTERIVTAFDHFGDVSALGHRAAARSIANDDLDLLVDLSTHTKGARPGILALKPARVQVTHVASAGTTGLAAIDFKLTDRLADLEGNFAEGLEAPLVIEGCVYPWRRFPAPGAAAELGAGREAFVSEASVSEASVSEGSALARRPARTVIGAFVTPLKLSQRCLALWRDVLQRIPDAVLAFSPLDPRTEPAYRSLVHTAGIDPERIVFVPRSGDEVADLARYRDVDFVLDPLPYGGVNGTLEPLAMGVPVVTLVGRRHGERTGYSILTHLGVTETIAQTGPEYVEIAARLAGDPSFMRAVRERIVAGASHSTLTDMPAHTRALERAYVAALEERAAEALVDPVR